MTPCLGDKGVDNFPKSICPKMFVIEWLQLELCYYAILLHNSFLPVNSWKYCSALYLLQVSNSHWNLFPNLSCQVLYSICAAFAYCVINCFILISISCTISQWIIPPNQSRLWIELPWTENPANTYARYTEILDSCFDLIRSYQQCIPWSPSLEIQLATT